MIDESPICGRADAAMTILIYTTEVIGVDPDDGERTLFKLRTFDEGAATLTIDTLVSPGTIGVLCDAIQQAMERLELEAL